MSELRIPRGALLLASAVGIALAGTASGAADRPATSHVAAASPSGTKASEDRDLKEIANYKLTMDAVRKFSQASRSMKKVEKKNPGSEEEDNDNDDDDDDKNDSESLADTEAKLSSIPAARNAIEAAGLSVHEYVLITFAMLQSAVAQYAIEQGADPAKIARDAGIHPANVTFYKEHKAEIDALSAGMK